MKQNEIVEKVKVAIEQLIAKDPWLLVNNLNERCITHKIATYLQEEFSDYDVDCEYNGNIESLNGSKMIYVLRQDLNRLKRLTKKEKRKTKGEILVRSVFPDIIVHKRGTNENNLCVIEVKKSTNKTPFDYDQIKLKAYTSSNEGNTLKYKLGVFIELVCNEPEIDYQLKLYEEGMEVNHRQSRRE